MRVKGGPNRRHRKILKKAKGFFGRRKNTIRTAKQSVDRAGQHAYIGRKLKKRNFRTLWIQRLNAAARANGLTYAQLINGLNKAGIDLDRKVLSDIAISDETAFAAIAQKAQAALKKTA